MNLFFQSTLIIALFSACYVHAGNISVNLGEAIQNHDLDIGFQSLGGHSGECITVSLFNHDNDSIILRLDGGEKIFCADSSMQNILLAQKVRIKIAPGQKTNIRVRGFCCALHKRSPSAGISFTWKPNNIPELEELGKFLAENPLISNTSMQSAVWVISDKQDLSTVYGDQVEFNNPLIRKLAQLTHQRIPWYRKDVMLDRQGFPTNIILKVQANYIFYLQQPSQVTIVIFDAKDQRVRIVLDEHIYQKGLNLYSDIWNTSNVPRGNYTVRIFADKEMIDEKEIKL